MEGDGNDDYCTFFFLPFFGIMYFTWLPWVRSCCSTWGKERIDGWDWNAIAYCAGKLNGEMG